MVAINTRLALTLRGRASASVTRVFSATALRARTSTSARQKTGFAVFMRRVLIRRDPGNARATMGSPGWAKGRSDATM